MNVYEWCVESLLLHLRQQFCRVRDIQQLRLFGGPTKNFDYVVRTPAGGLLLEVKGRTFPTSGGAKWENWTTTADLDALDVWRERVGEGYESLLVFVYRHRDPDVPPGRPWTPWIVDTSSFGLVACDVAAYRAAARIRSARWKTVTVPQKAFVKMVRPLTDFLPPPLGVVSGQTPRSAAGAADAEWVGELCRGLPSNPPA